MNGTRRFGADFGVVVTCSPYDWLFAKGTISSIRYFMPEAPLCLLVDGEIDTSLAESQFGATVVRRSDIEDRWLRATSFGWGLTKMNALWECPFERYLHLDADTTIWGHLGKKLSHESEVIWSVSNANFEIDTDYVTTWFFDPQGVQDRWPEFNWSAFVEQFACTGTFVADKGCLSLSRYRELLNANLACPGLFKFGEMGILNFMVFEAVQNDKITVEAEDFQVIFPEHEQNELRKRFSFDSGGTPVVVPGDEQVLHMPDQKPFVESKECYSRPMTFFRLKYLEKTQGVTGEAGMAALREEDAEYHRLRKQFLKRQKQQKLLNLLKLHRGEWRRLLDRLSTKLKPTQ